MMMKDLWSLVLYCSQAKQVTSSCTSSPLFGPVLDAAPASPRERHLHVASEVLPADRTRHPPLHVARRQLHETVDMRPPAGAAAGAPRGQQPSAVTAITAHPTGRVLRWPLAAHKLHTLHTLKPWHGPGHRDTDHNTTTNRADSDAVAGCVKGASEAFSADQPHRRGRGLRCARAQVRVEFCVCVCASSFSSSC